MPVERRPLTDAERLDWLQLSRTENVGPVTFFRLLQRYGGAGAALDALPELARRGGRARPLKAADRKDVAGELADLARWGGRLVAASEPDYPAALSQIEDAPPLIAVKGHLALARDRRCVALVGARNASLSGRKIARQMAAELGAAGFAVVSGLARGIDAAAHEATLGTGTIAVLAGGVDVVYPRENERLYAEIAERGLLLAESPMGTQPQARHFPRRNRIISGLSQGVVVVEAAWKSGSLITADYAADQGREVMAVPGSPLDPRCKGSNHLLRNGAHLVENAGDVAAALDSLGGKRLAEGQLDLFDAAPPAPEPDAASLKEARQALLDALSPTPMAVDELIRGCHLSAPVVLTVLLELELAGRLERHPGNRVSLDMDPKRAAEE